MAVVLPASNQGQKNVQQQPVEKSASSNKALDKETIVNSSSMMQVEPTQQQINADGSTKESNMTLASDTSSPAPKDAILPEPSLPPDPLAQSAL
ncbi:conserved hypothetical protein [Ricinus communis]|uniref:Uncharacterized protein n=1 Tax=Ricinus communis TaxID=3988 RepID=B9T956_RICCO|nr:conserved hypothetical protein [Ricinus communis]